MAKKIILIDYGNMPEIAADVLGLKQLKEHFPDANYSAIFSDEFDSKAVDLFCYKHRIPRKRIHGDDADYAIDIHLFCRDGTYVSFRKHHSTMLAGVLKKDNFKVEKIDLSGLCFFA